MKKIIALVLMVILVMSMTACANKSTETPDTAGDAETGQKALEGPDTADKPFAGTTLTYMASQDWIYDSEYVLAEQFEEETGIHIDFQIVPADQYSSLLLTKLNSGECTDLFGNQSGKFDLVSELDITKNAVVLNDEEWASRFDEFSANELSVDGNLYGVTLYDNTTDFYVVYNKKIFADLNLEVPKTYDEFAACCQKIMEAGTVPVYECVSEGWHHVMWFCEVACYEDNTPGMTEDLNNNKTNFTDYPDFLTNIEQIQDMVEKGYWGEYYMSNTYTDLPMYMNTGEYAMCLGKPGTIAEIVDYDPENCSTDDFGLFVIPLCDNQVYNVHPCAASKFIWSGSQNVEAAKLYLEFLCRPENLQYIIDNESRFENLPFEGLTPDYSQTTLDFVESYEKSGVVLQDIIKYLNPQWYDVGTDISAMLVGNMTPDEVISNIDARRAEQAEAAGDVNWE